MSSASGRKLDASLQALVGEWSRNQFGDRHPYSDGLAVSEEAGKVCQALLERGRDVNGNSIEPLEHWQGVIRNASADALIALLSLAEREGFDLANAVATRFGEVRLGQWPSVSEAVDRADQPDCLEPDQIPRKMSIDPHRLVSALVGAGWWLDDDHRSKLFIRLRPTMNAQTGILVPLDKKSSNFNIVMAATIQNLVITHPKLWGAIIDRVEDHD